MSDAANVTDPVLLVRVPKTFARGMSDLAVYEATRGVWKLGPRREGVRYVLAVHEGIVQEVFAVREWQPAGTAFYKTRSFDAKLLKGRWEFVGRRAPDAVRLRYLDRSVKRYIPQGAQNPVTYVNVP